MERNKLPRAFWFLAVVVLVSLLINLVTIVIAIRSPGGNSYPRETQTVPAPIDYSKISAIVQQQISAEPKAMDGVAGAPGQNGVPGKPGINGTDGSNGLNGTNGENGTQGTIGNQGPQGDPGSPGAEVELQYDALKAQIEWKYSTDFAWRPLVTVCVLTNTCVSP